MREVPARPILVARDLTKVYRRGSAEVRAVDGISLDVRAGEFMAIMGRSGSGKTTLLDLLGCLLRPTSGQLEVDGVSVIDASDGALARIRQARIGFVFQEFNLIPSLDATENVQLPLRYGPRRPDADTRARELLELVGLGARMRHRPSELSGGEQQRVAIARALVNEPAVVLADEPTGELDSTTSAELLSMLRQLNAERGVTFIIVTHDAGVASTTDRVVRLSDGRVRHDARRDEGTWEGALSEALASVPMGSQFMIVVEGLRKEFGQLTAVHDLSFTVGDGEIFGLLGPNGAGKTTTVRMLAGLIAPTAGSATVNGHPLGEQTQRIRALSGILTESPGLHERLTARQNLAFYGRLYGLRGEKLAAAVERYLGVVGMLEHADRRVNGFSKGMRQKIAIARALVHEPEVIYLDEPTSGLDPSAAKTVRDFVATLRELGRSIVVCTHNLDEAERLCDRIAIMQGTLLRVDTPAALRRHGRNASVRITLNGARGPDSFLDALVAMPAVLGAQTRDGDLLVELTDPSLETPDLIARLVAAGARITEVREEAATLEEVYLRLVGEAGERDARALTGEGEAA